jgi:hypothetical protein
MIFQVLMVASMKFTAFWDMALCRIIEVDRYFRLAYCLHHEGYDRPDDGDSKHFWNVGLLLRDYVAPCLRKLLTPHTIWFRLRILKCWKLLLIWSSKFLKLLEITMGLSLFQFGLKYMSLFSYVDYIFTGYNSLILFINILTSESL